MDLQRIPVPLLGLYVPHTTAIGYEAVPLNPALCNGRLADGSTNVLVRNGSWCAAPGDAVVTGFPSGANVNTYMLAAFEDTLLYVQGIDLKRFVRSTQVETTILTSIIPDQDYERMPWDWFRGYVLIGTNTNGLTWYKDGSARKCGVAAPTVAPAGTAGTATGLTGDYKLVYTYVNDQGHESDPSPESAAVTVTDDKINWTGIAVGPAGTSKRRLYRTVANGAALLYLGVIENNVTTVLTGDDLADTSLGTEVEYTNDVPPEHIRQMWVQGQRIYLIDRSDGMTIWPSKVESATGEPNFEAYPAELSFKVSSGLAGDELLGGFALGESSYACSLYRTYKLTGDPSTGTSVQKLLDFGLHNPYSWCYVPGGVCMFTSDRKLYLWDGANAPTNIGEDIDGLLKDTDCYRKTGNVFIQPTYYPTNDEIVLSYGPWAGVNTGCYVYSLTNKQWGHSSWVFNIVSHDSLSGILFGAYSGQKALRYVTESFTRVDSVATTLQLAPIMLGVDQSNRSYVSRIGVVLKATPLVSDIPPMVRISCDVDEGQAFTLTTDETKWKWYEFSSRGVKSTSHGAVAVAYFWQWSPEVTLYVPVYKHVRSVRLSLVFPHNAPINAYGFEVHSLFVEAEAGAPVGGEQQWPHDEEMLAKK